MVRFVQQLHVRHDNATGDCWAIYEVSDDGAIVVEVRIAGNPEVFFCHSAEDSTALVEFLGPKVKRVR